MKKIFKKLLSIFAVQSKWLSIVLPMNILGAFFVLIMINNVQTKTYDIERFNRAKETIRSPITIENEQETKRKMRETIQSVEDRYVIDEEITQERINYVEEIFDAVSKLETEKIEKKDRKTAKVQLRNDEKVTQLKQVLSKEITESLTDETLLKLIKLSEEEREQGKEIFVQAIKGELNNGVRIENIESARAEVEHDIKYSTLNANVKKGLSELTEFAIVENSFFDVEETLDARKEAANSVEPVVIRAGEVIVREGQIITNEVYEELNLVGLLKKEQNVFPTIGLILFIILIVTIIGYEMHVLANNNKLDRNIIISILIISFIVVSLMKVGSLFTNQMNQLYLIVPVATGSLLIKQLINERLSIVLATLYAILGSIIFNGEIPGSLNIETLIYFYFFQMSGILILMNIKDRLATIKAGLGMAVVNTLTILVFIFLSFEKYSLSELFIQVGFGIAAALLSAVLTIGLLPFFETGLGMLSDSKLLTLANPNQPLLRKILTEAPGTYHHSVMVANISETACEAIGANGLLARVGSYYHDIGKTIRPHYFIENQVAIQNPHDYTEPRQSAEIIISHVTEGVNMLKEHGLPQEIIDIAQEHHGTTLVSYFYYKAKEKNPNVNEVDFRYPGPKPQTKESAVISICDSVEAAVRSLKEPTEEKIDEIVTNIVNNRLMDGQFDETPLTLEELKVVHITVCEALKGIFHSRIQYPHSVKEAN